MSINLHLVGDSGLHVSLVQTPTYITQKALKIYNTGCSSPEAAEHAVKVYERYLIDDVKLTEDEVESAVREINAFLAFVPGAKFIGY